MPSDATSTQPSRTANRSTLDLRAELRQTEVEVLAAAQLPDEQALTPLAQLALRQLQIVRELHRRTRVIHPTS